MTTANRKATLRTLALFMAFATVVPMLSAGVGAEVPHENYDLISSDLQTVVSLLNMSINYTERSLVNLIDEDTVSAQLNLSTVQMLVVPADQLLQELIGIAESYENLSALLPPFVSLEEEEDAFILMEASLLEYRDIIVSLSGRTTLTNEEALAAMTAMSGASSLIPRMNASIDSMIVHALDITALTVEGRQPFAGNHLVELLEELRDLLYMIELELAEIIDNGGDIWKDVDPFLTLWIADPLLYLGETLVGGGYLFFEGAFQAGYEVSLVMDGSDLVSVTSGSFGRYSFSYEVPVNGSWLGNHDILARSDTPNGTLVSDTIAFSVNLVPTYLRLSANSVLLAPADTLILTATLTDVWGEPVGDAQCELRVDDATYDMTTDVQGRFTWTAISSEIGFGGHSAQADHSAALPYADTASNMLQFTVNIPTTLELKVFTERVLLGDYILGGGTLYANGSEPMDGFEIALSIDGRTVLNATTSSSGDFAFSITTEDLVAGIHTMKAELLNRSVEWRYSSNETAFTIYTRRTSDYPFWPIIPGWGDIGPAETIPDLFFGRTGYLAWLVVIAFIIAVVKVLRAREVSLARRTGASEGSASVGLSGPDTEEPEGDAWDHGTGIPASAPQDPTARIVWHYNGVLRFLKRRRNIAIGENMTHWEIARFLRAIGYPGKAVENLTRLFEKAFYSGQPATEEEAAMMRTLAEELKSGRKRGESPAA